MLPDRVSNPGPLTYESGALPIALRARLVGQGPTVLAVGAWVGGCLDIFSLIYPFFPLSPSLWETARYRLKYCLKRPLNPKPTNQPGCRELLNVALLFYVHDKHLRSCRDCQLT